jgi:hypothetical protein
MKNEVYSISESYQQILDDSPDPLKVKVFLLDQDNLPMARGMAVLPLLLGVGVFWPSCPMPDAERLAQAKCFSLPGGETLKLSSLSLCPGSPPHYRFWVNPL